MSEGDKHHLAHIAIEEKNINKRIINIVYLKTKGAASPFLFSP
jgi:hypothetical protein